MTKERKNKVKATIGTIIFHILVIATLFFLALTTPLPLPGEEGVEVNIGNSPEGMGKVQAEQPAAKIPIKPRPTPPPEKEEIKEDLITQDVEEAPAIDEKKEEEKIEKEKPVEKPQPDIEEEVVEEVEPEPEPPKVDPRALYKGKSDSESGQDEGITGQPGDQGKENGDPDSKNYAGPGGAGNGVSFSLGGRGAKHLPKPTYNSEEQGKVVVTIWVDKEGKVVKALAGAKGTNITDLNLQKLAQNAALRSVFQSDPNAPETQKGTITYNFLRLN